MQFQISFRRGNKYRDTKSSRLELIEKFLAKQFCFIRCRRQHFRVSGDIGDIAILHLLRTLLAICQKSREQSFLQVIYSFVLLEYASLAASGTLLS